MEILELYMSHFGKFTDQGMKFHSGVNIIYGENETGKSTVGAFIRAMLFGLTRARGRAAATDEYMQRQPWENGAWFSGILRFKSGGKIFRLERDFSGGEKETILYCETDGEELDPSRGDLQMLLNGMEKSAFDNTVFFGGISAETGETLANVVRNNMLNISMTGNDSIDLAGTIESLQQKRRELERKKKQCVAEQVEQMQELNTKLSYTQQEIDTLAQEEITCREKIKELGPIRQEDGQEAVDAIFAQENLEATKKLGVWKIGKIFMALVAVGALAAGFLLPAIEMRMLAGAVILGACVGVILLNRKDQEQKEWRQKQQHIRREQALQEAWARQQAWKNEERVQAPKRQRLLLNLEWVSESRKEKMAQYQNLKEEYETLRQEKGQIQELEQEIAAVSLAIDTFKEVGQELYREYAQKLNRRVSEIVSEITQGKYTGISLDENFQVRIQTSKKLLSIHQMSRGSIEQIYFALRMACAELMMPDEYFPIILDDAFVTYDDARLERTLKWLERSGHQVLLFTCHKREQEILQRIS